MVIFFEDEACWLYFDISYCRRANPNLDPEDIANAFYKTIYAFFL